jgi:hypothetical protein
MDALDRVAEPGADLLARVDAALSAAGAPAGHAIWSRLRRLGALPGAAADAVVALRPAPIAAAGTALRTLAREYADTGAAGAPPAGWHGVGARAYAGHWAGLSAHLAHGDESLAGRLAATAGYADALADWIRETRRALARALATVLGSAQAVALVTGPSVVNDRPGAGQPRGALATVLAAAEIGVHVLDPLARAYDRAEDLRLVWAPRLVELAHRPGGAAAVRADSVTRVPG